MAECHPVAFQWVMEAKARGATVIHVDPRFTRTSAVADLYVPIRAGADIAFLGGLINHVLRPATVLPRIRRSPTRTRRRSSARTSRTPRTSTGCSPASTRAPDYDPHLALRGRVMAAAAGSAIRRAASRAASGGDGTGSRGRTVATPTLDRTLAASALRVPGPEAALRPLHPGDGRAGLRHPAGRLRPGLPSLVVANSGRERPPAFVLRGRLDPAHDRRPVHPHRVDPAAAARATSAGPAAASWRCAGTPRSRAPPTSRPCSTCCPATCRCRTRGTTTWTSYLRRDARTRGFWGNMRAYTVSLLKAWCGDGRHGRERLLLRLPAADHRQPQHLRDRAGADRREGAGLLPVRAEPGGRLGERPDAAPGHGQPGLAGGPRPVTDRERHVLEGRAGDRDRRDAHRGHRRPRCSSCPAAAHTEKDGTFTNTQRMLQWHDKAVEPPGRRAQRPVVRLPPRPAGSGSRLAGSADERDRPMLDLTWDYPTDGHRRARRRGGPAPRSTARTRSGRLLSAYTELRTTARPRAAAGSTAGSTPTG